MTSTTEPFGMHEASIGLMVHVLGNLSAILAKAEAHTIEDKIDPASLIEARLAPDMLPFSRQIQIASDAAKNCAARLAGVNPPSMPDTEASFAELHARVAKTVTFIQGFTADQIDGSENRSVTFNMGGKPVTMTGRNYLTQFALPNFFFHVTTAYAILRHKGLKIGKLDYLGPLTFVG